MVFLFSAPKNVAVEKKQEKLSASATILLLVQTFAVLMISCSPVKNVTLSLAQKVTNLQATNKKHNYPFFRYYSSFGRHQTCR